MVCPAPMPTPPTMKAALLRAFTDDLSAFELAELPRPAAAPGFAVVEVVAAAANPVDCIVMAGMLDGVWSCPLPMILGYDLSGVVVELGEGVEGLAVGDEVFAVNWGQRNHGPGTEAEPIGGAFPASKLSAKPAGLGHAQAAAVALVGTTAWQGLDVLGVGAGTTVVVLGGSGAVGMLAVQLAKLRGAEVITTCSPRTRAFVEGLGADRIIDYTAGPWFEDAALRGLEIDAVFDAAGAAGTFTGARERIRPGGSFISIANVEVGFDPHAHAPLAYASYFCLTNDPRVQDELARLLVSGRLKLPIEAEFGFDHDGIAAMLRRQQGRGSVGKNVLVVQ